ncbi:hypothetical protein SAZ10_04620 [Mesorhizobium sp. BAC0120]|uniref:hypothetical protein n=1 Tax=Mesorhizobium sp. BAC0120 TaxID=3090670 RepID=UPI00298BD237|nr:hypothetical protein [Mesorhizobium sp. BAC0120]MDW6021042.1 hypothetical protein [Mesorhizobium sp. BAC0120]
MRKLLSCLAAGVIAATVSVARADPAQDAAKLADIFCQLGKQDGEFGRLYLVTKSLGVAIAEAIKKNGEIASAHPDEKPPLGDGIPFQSYPDVAPVCKPGKFTDTGRTQVIEIVYEFPDKPAASWTDRLVLITEEGRPRIDDILFGTADSDNGLRKALAAAFQN